MMRVWVTLLLLAGMPATGSSQFDLVCTANGSQTRYRVDLASNEACSDTCDRIWKMGVPTAGELKLIDQAPAFQGDFEERATVNRQTGAYAYTNFIKGLGRESESGECVSAPFSGFPRSKF